MGWSVAEDGRVGNFGEFKIASKNDTRGQRFSILRQKVLELISTQKPEYVIYERPFARGRDATRCLWGFAAVIEQAAHDSGLASIDQLPGTIKKFATGRGDASKEAMIQAAEPLAVCFDLNEHEADAILLSLYASENVEAS